MALSWSTRASIGTSAVALLLSACEGPVLRGGADGGEDPCRLGPRSLWVVEGTPLSAQLFCETGLSLDGQEVRIRNLPAGAELDAATHTLQWTPDLSAAAVYQLEAEVVGVTTSTNVTIGVADAFDHPDNQPIVSQTEYSMELGLPVLFLESAPQSEDYVPVRIVYRGKELEAEAKLRGKSSLTYPKQSYALRLDGANELSETELADFAGRRRVIITSTFDDNAYFRQRLAYDLWNALEPTIEIQAFSAVVYIDNQYWGLYTISDHVNARLMQSAGLSDQGNLFKAENHDANFRLTDHDGNAKGSLAQGYSKTEGEPPEGDPGAFVDMEALVSFVATSDGATFDTEIGERIEIDDYVAWWMIATFALAGDSMGKNSYHYHDATRTWRCAPWDFNASFGQDWQTMRLPTDATGDPELRNELFARLVEAPSHRGQIRARYRQELDGGAFAKDRIQSLLDRYVSELEASAERDWARWQDAYRSFDRWSSRTDFTTPAEEMAYVRNWLAGRWDFASASYAE